MYVHFCKDISQKKICLCLVCMYCRLHLMRSKTCHANGVVYASFALLVGACLCQSCFDVKLVDTAAYDVKFARSFLHEHSMYVDSAASPAGGPVRSGPPPPHFFLDQTGWVMRFVEIR